MSVALKSNEDPFATIANWSLLTSGGEHGENIVPEGDGSLTTGDGLTHTIDENAGTPPSADGGNSGNQPPGNGGGGNGSEPPNDENWTPPNDGNIYQNSNILKTLYQRAGPAYNELKEFATHFVNHLGSGDLLFNGLKDPATAAAKIKREYDNVPGRLLDIARRTIKFDAMEDVNRARTQIESELKNFAPDAEIVRVKDRFAKPTETGYRDLMLNIRMSNGHIAELQIHLSTIHRYHSNPLAKSF